MNPRLQVLAIAVATIAASSANAQVSFRQILFRDRGKLYQPTYGIGVSGNGTTTAVQLPDQSVAILKSGFTPKFIGPIWPVGRYGQPGKASFTYDGSAYAVQFGAFNEFEYVGPSVVAQLSDGTRTVLSRGYLCGILPDGSRALGFGSLDTVPTNPFTAFQPDIFMIADSTGWHTNPPGTVPYTRPLGIFDRFEVSMSANGQVASRGDGVFYHGIFRSLFDYLPKDAYISALSNDGTTAYITLHDNGTYPPANYEWLAPFDSAPQKVDYGMGGPVDIRSINRDGSIFSFSVQHEGFFSTSDSVLLSIDRNVYSPTELIRRSGFLAVDRWVPDSATISSDARTVLINAHVDAEGVSNMVVGTLTLGSLLPKRGVAEIRLRSLLLCEEEPFKIETLFTQPKGRLIEYQIQASDPAIQDRNVHRVPKTRRFDTTTITPSTVPTARPISLTAVSGGLKWTINCYLVSLKSMRFSSRELTIHFGKSAYATLAYDGPGWPTAPISLKSSDPATLTCDSATTIGYPTLLKVTKHKAKDVLITATHGSRSTQLLVHVIP